jgi:hypothetical protein
MDLRMTVEADGDGVLDRVAPIVRARFHVVEFDLRPAPAVANAAPTMAEYE